MIAQWWRSVSIAVRCWWLTFLVGRLAKMVSKEHDRVFKANRAGKVK